MWTCSLILLLLVLTPQSIISVEKRDIEIVYQWKQLVYGFATPEDRKHAESNGHLVPENGTPIDVARHQHGNASRVIITIPRFTTGIPYTLAVVSNKNEANGPVLQPYPDYSYHNGHGDDCDKISSGFRVAVTECNQLFVMDSGIIGSTQVCPPQLLVFDLNTDTLIQRYRFESNVYLANASLVMNPLVVVDDLPPTGRCQRFHVYIADVSYHGLVVYDSVLNTAWRVENRFMYPDPDHGEHTIAGEKFIMMEGMFALATDQRDLYFHPLATRSEYAVPLSVLNNRTVWMENLEAMPEEFRLVGQRNSECAAEAMDSKRNLYCVTFNPIKLVRWNLNKEASRYNGKHEMKLKADPQLLQFVAGVKVFKNDEGKDELWMLSNKYHKVATGNLRDNEVNFRVMRRLLDDIQLKSTKSRP